jgi:hypothetical protein
VPTKTMAGPHMMGIEVKSREESHRHSDCDTTALMLLCCCRSVLSSPRFCRISRQALLGSGCECVLTHVARSASLSLVARFQNGEPRCCQLCRGIPHTFPLPYTPPHLDSTCSSGGADRDSRHHAYLQLQGNIIAVPSGPRLSHLDSHPALLDPAGANVAACCAQLQRVEAMARTRLWCLHHSASAALRLDRQCWCSPVFGRQVQCCRRRCKFLHGMPCRSVSDVAGATLVTVRGHCMGRLRSVLRAFVFRA